MEFIRELLRRLHPLTRRHQFDSDLTAWLYPLGRLRPGVQEPVIEAKLSALPRQWMQEWPRFTEHGGTEIIRRQHVKFDRAGAVD